MTSIAILSIGIKVTAKKNCRKCHLRRLWVEFRQNSLKDDQEMLHAFRGQSAPQSLPDMTSLAASGRLQNAIKYCTKVRKCVQPAKGRIIQSTFNVESPNFTGAPHRVGHPRRHNLQPTGWRYQLLPIGIYRSSKKLSENAAFDGFG